MRNRVLISAALTLLFSFSLLSDDRDKSEMYDIQEQLSSIVVGILTEENAYKYKDNISPEAYIIVDNHYQSFFEVINKLPDNFSEGEKTIVGYMHIWLTEDNNAYMLFQTTTVDEINAWHSVFFKLNDKDKWQILNWHKS